ncbi:hypothetical protein [Nostoc sp.]|uniref:hypothetical protein n=1 Tax=Nostoc sp. TaxID=1180 RepID=UPI002FFB3C3D
MQIEQPFRINAAQPDKLKQFLPKPLIISSPVAGWNGFYFAYHRQSNYQLPKTSPFQHIIGIYSREFEGKLKINGHWQSKSYAATDVGIFPAHQISPAVQFEQLSHACIREDSKDRLSILQRCLTKKEPFCF